MLFLCTLVFVLIVIWCIMHQPDPKYTKKREHDIEPEFDPTIYKAARYARHMMRHEQRKRRM